MTRGSSLRIAALCALGVAAILVVLAPTSVFAARSRPQTKPPATSPKKPAPKPSAAPARKKPAPAIPSSKAPASTKTDQQLADLVRALGDKPVLANEQRLVAFAQLHSKDEDGAGAALALGKYFLDKSRPADALKWLDAALRQPNRLQEYAVFWHAQALRQLGRNDDALQQLDSFLQKYPQSVIGDLAVQSFAEAAMALGNAQRAAAALDVFPKTPQKTSLLLLRAQAREKSGSAIASAKDYLALYYGFPLSDEARAAGSRIPELSRRLGESFPGVPLAQQTARAEALYDAHRWNEARQEFEALLPQTSADANAHARLRILQCRSGLGNPSALGSASFTEPEAEAERLYTLSQAYRTQKREPEMLEAVSQVTSRFPQSPWAGEAFFSTGNYFWVALDRARAATYYRRVADGFPASKNAAVANWRAAWVAYLDRSPDAVGLLESFVRNFPTSNIVPDALYWLGRAAERDGNVPHARSFYVKGAQRFPQTFFGLRAADRLSQLGTEPLNPAEVLSAIPDPPTPTMQLDAPVPAESQERWQRAVALRRIGFDSSAELELRAAYIATPAPRLLLEAAEAAVAAEHYGVGITLARQAYPQPEAHRANDLPPAIARVLYPLPFLSLVTRASATHTVDPMLVTGVMRQESAFQSSAVSRAGAMGLMQVLPKTAPALARRLRLSYARARLFDPAYNLQLGTLYLSDLLAQFGTPEAALAAYNAGEDRVKLWQSERNYADVNEFVESIPFTETRDYVQIVLRNAAIYRILNPPAPVAAKSAPAKTAPVKTAPTKASAHPAKSTRGKS